MIVIWPDELARVQAQNDYLRKRLDEVLRELEETHQRRDVLQCAYDELLKQLARLMREYQSLTALVEFAQLELTQQTPLRRH